MKVLVTGSAGFIGYHTTLQLLERGDEVVGIDNINDYYDVRLKYGRLQECGIASEQASCWNYEIRSEKFSAYRFFRLDLTDRQGIADLFSREKFHSVIHLAAQAGVRYSLINPYAYIDSNITGMLNILEGCRHNPVEHLVYASSSSVYGLNETMPFSTRDSVDHPVSLYAATKKSNELMAHSYSKLYNIPTTGLRFFTVYGPWGRPDMALFLFTKAILEGQPIDVFNHGDMSRDFTYVDDIVEGLLRVLDKPARPDLRWNSAHPSPESSISPYRIYNIGNSSPVRLAEFIEAIEEALGKKTIKNYISLQNGDVLATWADISDLKETFGYKPVVSVKDGIQRFIDWYIGKFLNIN
ncbi:NAD-dependent epimerase [Aminobacterium colombiense]